MYSYAFHTYISKRIIFVTEIIPKATWPCISCVKITFMIKVLHKYVSSLLEVPQVNKNCYDKLFHVLKFYLLPPPLLDDLDIDPLLLLSELLPEKEDLELLLDELFDDEL